MNSQLVARSWEFVDHLESHPKARDGCAFTTWRSAVDKTFERFCSLLAFSLLLSTSTSVQATYSQRAVVFGPTVPTTVVGSADAPPSDSVEYDFSRRIGTTLLNSSVTFSSSPIASIQTISQITTQSAAAVRFVTNGMMVYTFDILSRPSSVVPISFSGVFSASQGIGEREISNKVSFEIFEGTGGNPNGPQFSLEYLKFRDATGSVPFFAMANGFGTTYRYTESNGSSIFGDFNGIFSLTTNANGQATGSIRLSSNATLSVSSGTLSLQSLIDPHIEIDAAYLAANPGARLIITPGVGNEVSAVPELNSLSALALGLFVVFHRLIQIRILSIWMASQRWLRTVQRFNWAT